ncbi:hypothetical protein BpHYR1_007983 [Brachionus plicatilis]|uniref:Uncharacterized protein n=1 Tax=Brachionus plicatilis TaxID=10195 RepID=A0A3M7Q7W5_BRAPC|nr:hypothetical protein BpHYR1_007983 [Brachionus plicatilis]
MKIDVLIFNIVVDTFYLSTKLSFHKIEPNIELNNKIKSLALFKTIRLNLDVNSMNPNVFKSLESLEITVLGQRNNFKFIDVLFKDPGYIDYGTFQPHVHLNNTFPDEDFCLYMNFPFGQLVFFIFDTYIYSSNSNQPVTCSLVWITHNLNLLVLYKPQLSDFDRQKLKILEENYKKCNFEERIKIESNNT